MDIPCESNPMSDLTWTTPVMRAGYAGRGLTYLSIAGLSLYAIWRGGEAKGTGSTMESLSTSLWGLAVLWLIAVGLMAYAVWCIINAWADLDAEGSEASSLVKRVGQAIKGAIYLALAGLAATAALGVEGSGAGIPGLVSTVLGWPGGWLLVALVGFGFAGAGLAEISRGVRATYRKHLAANPFTTHWDWALRVGLIAQGVSITLIGSLFLYAAWTGRAGETGGVDTVFEFLDEQTFGNAMVVATCLGFLAFAFYCFVNAAYRVIPKVADVGMETLAAKLKAMA